jgi:hypothetical protein
MLSFPLRAVRRSPGRCLPANRAASSPQEQGKYRAGKASDEERASHKHGDSERYRTFGCLIVITASESKT